MQNQTMTPLVKSSPTAKCGLIFLIPIAGFMSPAGAEITSLNPKAKIEASSEREGYPASKAADGTVSDSSRWLSEEGDGPHVLTFTFPSAQEMAGIHLYSGYEDGDPVQDFHVEFLSDEKWTEIPSSKITGNKTTALGLPFDAAVKVEGTALRLVIEKTPKNIARIREMVVWPAGSEDFPRLNTGVDVTALPTPDNDPGIPLIYLNQAGFNLEAPKRFTAPTLPDGTPFEIVPAAGGEAVHTGTITGRLGDFSDFKPSKRADWILKAGGLSSVPFTIAPWHLEKITYQLALDFMIESRLYVGNVRENARGSFSWRDDHHFAWSLATLVPMWLSNPSAWENLPSQVEYEKPDDRKLWGALEPYSEDAPDLVKLIHWGADTVVSQKLDHELLKADLAYFLYAWPWIEEWLPAQNREVVQAYVNEMWDKPNSTRKYPYNETPSKQHDLFALKTKIGSTKGPYPPGFSVEPNLLMYEVARRSNAPDAGRYFDAAYRQVEWMIQNLDWEDPQVTKGQRMSEHRTIPGMAMFLRLDPDRAPAGLRQKIKDWADVALRRSDNMWDFRKLTDDGQWTPSGDKPTMWNEVGNVVGFPAIAFAAASVIDDKSTKDRLEELAWSHFDNCFGRNPTGRHFSYDAPREIEGVEFGWYSFYPGGIGQLAEVPFVLDGAPKHQHYPYNPEVGNVGWTEGWIQFNGAYNLSLAYLAQSTTRITVEPDGEKLVVRVEGAFNLNPAEKDQVTIRMKLDGGEDRDLTITRVRA